MSLSHSPSPLSVWDVSDNVLDNCNAISTVTDTHIPRAYRLQRTPTRTHDSRHRGPATATGTDPDSTRALGTRRPTCFPFRFSVAPGRAPPVTAPRGRHVISCSRPISARHSGLCARPVDHPCMHPPFATPIRFQAPSLPSFLPSFPFLPYSLHALHATGVLSRCTTAHGTAPRTAPPDATRDRHAFSKYKKYKKKRQLKFQHYTIGKTPDTTGTA